MNTTTSVTPKTIVIVGATGHPRLLRRPDLPVPPPALARPRPNAGPNISRRPKPRRAGRRGRAGGPRDRGGDTTDAGGASSFEAAFADAHAIFLNTDFWAPYRTALAAGATQDAASRTGFETEMRHARHAVAAAAKSASSTLERLVYSALAPLREASDGRYTHSYHWDSKAAAASWIASPASGVAEKASYIYVGAYSTNPLILPQKLKKEKTETTMNAGAAGDEEYEYVMRLPAGRRMRMPVLDIAASTGPFVRCLVEDEPANTNLLAYDEYLDVDGLLRAWTEAVSSSDDDNDEKTPLPPRFVQMGLHEMNRATGLPLEVLEAPPFVEEFGYMGGVSGGFVEPHQLRNRPGTRAFAVTLKSHGREYLLGAKLPTAATI
ncbi:hypothetical protein PG997_012125 [Apiospora hydei]|uniref:NmrA-like domain-containing protein n=1 Tax=Apiospora hydei TaxID=1337664 RepID=A0ABR1V2H9_9PEZI